MTTPLRASSEGPQPRQWSVVVHVPRSQVWQGSRGGHRPHQHLHTVGTFRRGRIERDPNMPLCGKARGWYERPADGDEPRCAKCAELAERFGFAWPEVARV